MTDPRTSTDIDDVPAVGSPVTLLPTSAEGMCVAEVRSWTASPTGLVVTGQVATTPEIAELMDGQRVWASARTRVTDSLVVFEAVAQRSGARRDELSLSGVVRLAHEKRRAVVRAPAERSVEVVAANGESLHVRTVDLSRDGCRVALQPDQSLPEDETVHLRIDLDEQTSVRATGEVLRVDPGRRHAVLRFLEMEPDDRQRIERVVLSRLRTGLDRG